MGNEERDGESAAAPPSPTEPSVPQKTLETLARNFCREAREYGFTQIDYLRYVNYLLEYGTQGDAAEDSDGPAPPPSQEGEKTIPDGAADTLPLRGSRVRVRAFEPETDRELFRRWLTDDYGRYFLLSRISGRRADIDSLLANRAHILGVITLHSGEPVGCVAYLNHDKLRKKAELRKLIGEPAHRRTGLAREATALWIAYGLNALGLRKIYVNTLHTHFRNIKLNESLGFKVEGLLHHEALIDGRYHDVLRMGLWQPDDTASG